MQIQTTYPQQQQSLSSSSHGTTPDNNNIIEPNSMTNCGDSNTDNISTYSPPTMNGGGSTGPMPPAFPVGNFGGGQFVIMAAGPPTQEMIGGATGGSLDQQQQNSAPVATGFFPSPFYPFQPAAQYPPTMNGMAATLPNPPNPTGNANEMPVAWAIMPTGNASAGGTFMNSPITQMNGATAMGANVKLQPTATQPFPAMCQCGCGAVVGQYVPLPPSMSEQQPPSMATTNIPPMMINADNRFSRYGAPRQLPVSSVDNQHRYHVQNQHQYSRTTTPDDQDSSDQSKSCSPDENSDRRPRRKMGYYSNILYKTEECSDYKQRGNCPRGKNCQYAHGAQEIHDPKNHPLYKTALCYDFKMTGTCPRRDKCFHVHGVEEMRIKVPRFRNTKSVGGPRFSNGTRGSNSSLNVVSSTTSLEEMAAVAAAQKDIITATPTTPAQMQTGFKTLTPPPTKPSMLTIGNGFAVKSSVVDKLGDATDSSIIMSREEYSRYKQSKKLSGMFNHRDNSLKTIIA